MRGGFDRLTKEIDTLTYNSRSVLNALIRSTVASGSTNGYTSTRAGIDITLTRVDIYRLYKFFQDWENSNFDPNVFTALLAEHDAVPVVDDTGTSIDNPTTPAVIKHSKVLFLNNDTLSQLAVDSYWLGLVQNANNAKLISNAAPIPLNLRTPIFDENLSTTKYNQHDTYLFPFSYYSVELLGYSGDNADHHMDGSSWTIGADHYISLESDAISFGGVNDSDVRKTKARRNHDVDASGNAFEVTYSTAFGYGTQARAKYSTAGGLNTIIPRGAVSAVAIGDGLLATDSYAVAIGGLHNKSVGIGSGILGGTGNTAAGQYSGILGGINNSVGGYPDSFKFPASDSSLNSCIILNETECALSNSGSSIGRSLISVTGNVAYRYYIGDTVAVHSLTSYYSTGSNIQSWGTNGDAYQTQQLMITSIQYIDPTVYPTNINKGNTLITLSGDVVGNGVVDGGVISRVKDRSGNLLGYTSVALNNSNIAIGASQTVVGKYNYLVENARFVVGNGTGDGIYTRSNSFEVRDDGASIYGSTHNQYYTPSNYVSIDFTVNYIGIRGNAKGSVINLYEDNAQLYLNSYIGLFESTTAETYNTILSSYDKPMILRSGETRTYSLNTSGSDIAIFAGDRFLTASEDITIISAKNYIIVDTSNDLILNWDGSLELMGDTFGALPTTDQQFAHYIKNGYISAYTIKSKEETISGICNSGFYDVYRWTGDNTFTGAYESYTTSNILLDSCEVLTVGGSDSEGYHSWKLMFPNIRNYTGKIPQIAVSFDELSTTGEETTISKGRATRYLAYADDVGAMGVWSTLYNDGSKLFSAIQLIDANGAYHNITNQDHINNLIRTIRITSIGKTSIIQLKLYITDFISKNFYSTTGQVNPIGARWIDLIIDQSTQYFTDNNMGNISPDGLCSGACTSPIYMNGSTSTPALIATYGIFNNQQSYTVYNKGIRIDASPYGFYGGYNASPSKTNASTLEYTFTLIGEILG